MSNVLIAFLVAVSATAWIYSKVTRSTGGANARDSIIIAGVCGGVIFLVALMLLNFVPK